MSRFMVGFHAGFVAGATAAGAFIVAVAVGALTFGHDKDDELADR